MKFLSFKSLVVIINCVFLAVGQIGGVILIRLYFLHGGKRKWLSSYLLTAGFPCLLVPIFISFAKNRAKAAANRRRVLVTPRLFASSAFLGLLLGVDSYLYTFGMSYLPVSISSLLSSTQLAFTAVFAYFIVKHKMTHYSVNAVVLMTFGSVVLGLHMGGDRPEGESDGRYKMGFFMTIAGAALHGFIVAGVEYAHLHAGVPVTNGLVLQVQFVISMFSALFCIVAMIINKDFQAISKEAGEFGLGPTKYYMIVGFGAIALQLMIMGSLGVIFSSSALLLGIFTSLLVAVQQVFSVIFLPESFSADKLLSLAICIWGFASYFYGDYKAGREKPPAPVTGDNDEEHQEV
ncbi:purine permease 3-like [Ipomoea triloba]|uniref:purine permease 3-like n=1 Tax=Ipomoea triloba TaxID=35885 RepID=UPI00125DED23|nr:purine permease 3-like [Ipomoea triloba]